MWGDAWAVTRSAACRPAPAEQPLHSEAPNIRSCSYGACVVRRKHIPDAVTNRLYALSGNECAFPGCTNRLTQHVGEESPVTVGQRAHIVGVGRQGPRSEAAEVDDVDSVANLILLCGSCHARVDANPRIFSVEVLAKYKADHEAQVGNGESDAGSPAMATEAVDVSILPVTVLPDCVYVAPSNYRTTTEVAEHLPRPRGSQLLPFVLSGGSVWAFHDLREPKGPFSKTVEPAEAEELTIEETRARHRSMYVWLLNSALRSALRRRGVGHDREHDRYFFLADHEDIERRVATRSKLGRAQPQKKVVRQEGERSGNLKDVWWHLAAQLRFEEFAAGQWGLTIRPEYHLTVDGHTPLEPTRVGRKVTRRKSRMYNEGYFDAVHFLRSFLIGDAPRLVLRAGRQAAAIEGEFPSVEARWVQISDKRFDPVRPPKGDDEDDVLDAVVSEWEFEEEWDWGAEPSERDQ